MKKMIEAKEKAYALAKREYYPTLISNSPMGREIIFLT